MSEGRLSASGVVPEPESTGPWGAACGRGAGGGWSKSLPDPSGVRLVLHVGPQGTVRETRPVQCGRTHPCVLQRRVWVVRPYFQQQGGWGRNREHADRAACLPSSPQANCMRLCTLVYSEGMVCRIERHRVMSCSQCCEAMTLPPAAHGKLTQLWCPHVGVCAWRALRGKLRGACADTVGGALATVSLHVLRVQSTASGEGTTCNSLWHSARLLIYFRIGCAGRLYTSCTPGQLDAVCFCTDAHGSHSTGHSMHAHSAALRTSRQTFKCVVRALCHHLRGRQ